MIKTNQNAKQDKIVIFLHIPKAAGVTLQRIIEKQYDLSSIFTLDGIHFHESINELKLLPAAQKSKMKLLKGHMFFGLHEFLLKPSTYITVLRDPVDRLISHYYYVLENPAHYLYQEVTSKKMSLKDYAGSRLSGELDNCQTRLISGVESPYVLEQGYKQMLEIAKYNLKSYFAVVGLVEKFNETLMLLKSKLEWRMPFYVRHNQTYNRLNKESISPKTLDMIRNKNELDIELYNYGKTIFEELVMQYGASFEKDLKLFNLFNGSYQKSRNIYSSSRLAALKMIGRC